MSKKYYFHKSLPQLNFDKTLDKIFGNKNLEKNYFHKKIRKQHCIKNHWDECQRNYNFYIHECQKNIIFINVCHNLILTKHLT